MPVWRQGDGEARYNGIDLLSVALEAQLVLGLFAHALHHQIDELNLSALDAHYRNDAEGTAARTGNAVASASHRGQFSREP